MKEILKHLVEKTVLPEDSYLDQDAEILEIFVEELEEIFENLQPLLNQWMDEPTHDGILVTVRRNFHTLKGSGRMVGAKSSAELAWIVEDTLNRVIAKNVALTPAVQKYVRAVFNLYQFKLFQDFQNNKAHTLDFRPLVILGQQLQQNLSLEPALDSLLDLADTLTHTEAWTGLEQTAESPALEASTMSANTAPLDQDILIPEFKQKVAAKSESNLTPVATEAEALLSVTLSIFVEEAEEHLVVIDHFVQHEQHTPEQHNRLVRALHTLRGSSSMAHVNDICEVSTRVETLFKQLLKQDIETSINENSLLVSYAEYVRDYLYILKLGTQDQAKFDFFLQRFNHAFERCDLHVSTLGSDENIQNIVSQLVNLNIDHLLDTEFEFDQRAQSEYPDYFEKLSQEAEILVENTNTLAAQGIHEYSLFLKTSYDAILNNRDLLNTDYVFELFGRVHQEFTHLFDHLASGQRVVVGDSAQRAMEDLKAYLLQDIDQVVGYSDAKDRIDTPDTFEFNIPSVSGDLHSNLQSNNEAGQTSQVSTEHVGLSLAYVSNQIAADRKLIESDTSIREFDLEVLDIFIEEAEELLVEIDRDLNTWTEDIQDTRALNNLMRHLHTLKGGANMVQAEHIGFIAHELESIYERVINAQMSVSHELVKYIRLMQDDVSDRVQLIRDERVDYPATHIVAVLHQISDPNTQLQDIEVNKDQTVTDHTDIEVSENLHAGVEDRPSLQPQARFDSSGNLYDLLAPTSFGLTSQPESDSESKPEQASASKSELEPEPELTSETAPDSAEAIARETFVEEAEELIAEAENILPKWFEQRSSRSLLLQLQRIAHSLKGGAKMVGWEQVAEIAYELETAFEEFAVNNFNSNAYDTLLQSAFAWLKTAVLEQNYQHFNTLKSSLSNIHYLDVSTQLTEKLARSDLLSEQYVVESIEGDGTEPPSMLGEWDQSTQVEQSDEMIRISADLIEKMIDLSGENAINRSRIEMDLSQLGHTLTDMELAIQRLADQLRRMEGELESQILAKHDDLGARYEDFDPLEMDQYSSLNQLSKSLAESASDLVDFKSTLAEKIKDTEGVLLQQSRIQAEIQEGLMRARLVPFSRLLPRLQRLVRQVSTTLNKPTELFVNNTEGELDRTILEKLVSPLEHMLRNALDHGIESTAERLKNHKPVSGKIELDIRRQGSDILVSFTDDGQGIDAEKIKAKAIAIGLMQDSQAITNEEILQFIFHPGFSTAEKVTQISGRGVGLDVVQSGIKSLGGQVSVASQLGKGSTFTIRVPTTVAVSDALMVKIGDQQFAVPLSQIDRIVRIAPSALEQYFSSNADYFDIDHQRYKLRYLGEFVADQPVPKLSGVGHSLPVLLIKGNMGQTTALLIDQLIGSRSQIVMKPIGGQFASVGVVAGATILGDGQVCLILDGQNIARQIQATQRDDQKIERRDPLRKRDHRHLVMIVDDSVTVRKVTSRLLERQGFDVITAKDGIDAIEQLENVKPDLMLLDIEMPRMDGFEVTSLVRHHEVHRDLPIIMITSRTGEKHRERAFSLGVTNYMGKPFQESMLLENIEAALETK